LGSIGAPQNAAKAAAEATAGTLATNQELKEPQLSIGYRGLLFLERKRITPVRPETHHESPDTVDLIIELRNTGNTAGTNRLGLDWILLPRRV